MLRSIAALRDRSSGRVGSRGPRVGCGDARPSPSPAARGRPTRRALLPDRLGGDVLPALRRSLLLLAAARSVLVYQGIAIALAYEMPRLDPAPPDDRPATGAGQRRSSPRGTRRPTFRRPPGRRSWRRTTPTSRSSSSTGARPTAPEARSTRGPRAFGGSTSRRSRTVGSARTGPAGSGRERPDGRMAPVPGRRRSTCPGGGPDHRRVGRAGGCSARVARPADRDGRILGADGASVLHPDGAHLRSAPRTSTATTSQRAMANGQFCSYVGADYDALGGHEAIRGLILEDVALARGFRAAGQPIRVALAPDLAATRMYRDRHEMFEGLAKNIHGTRFSARPTRPFSWRVLVGLFWLPLGCCPSGGLVGSWPLVSARGAARLRPVREAHRVRARGGRPGRLRPPVPARGRLLPGGRSDVARSWVAAGAPSPGRDGRTRSTVTRARTAICATVLERRRWRRRAIRRTGCSSVDARSPGPRRAPTGARPATNAPFAQAAAGGRDDARHAIEVADAAFRDSGWAGDDGAKRAKALARAGAAPRGGPGAVRARSRPETWARRSASPAGDIGFVVRTLEYVAGLADKIQGETIPVPGQRLDYTVREPLGVTVHIAPWNYPLLLAIRSVAPALAAGNAVVLKPASLTPLTAIAFAAPRDRTPGSPTGSSTSSSAAAARSARRSIDDPRCAVRLLHGQRARSASGSPRLAARRSSRSRSSSAERAR